MLAFPCNAFGAQEPESEPEIKAFVQKEFGVTFPMFSKIEVNGDDAHPLFTWLRTTTVGDDAGSDIKWNFTKFLLRRDGTAAQRFGHRTNVLNVIEPRIDKLLEKGKL